MSITLTTGTNVVINGVQAENDTIGGCTGMSVDYLGNTVTFTFTTGTLLNGNINGGNFGPKPSLTVNLSTGAWSASSGQSGVIGATALANFVSQLKSDRNLVETFAAGASGILPGVQVAW